MTGDKQRIAEIEALFRAGNDRMMAWEERQGAGRGERLTFFCECGRRRCRQHVHLTTDEYEAVRVESRRFIVAPGHELPDAEDVVERHDRYFVVEKHEDVWPLVRRMDLRTDTGDRPQPSGGG
jgi:hypothetical protein